MDSSRQQLESTIARDSIENRTKVDSYPILSSYYTCCVHSVPATSADESVDVNDDLIAYVSSVHRDSTRVVSRMKERLHGKHVSLVDLPTVDTLSLDLLAEGGNPSSG
jgi:hypothetical protein